jgi:hypothetical protein
MALRCRRRVPAFPDHRVEVGLSFVWGWARKVVSFACHGTGDTLQNRHATVAKIAGLRLWHP